MSLQLQGYDDESNLDTKRRSPKIRCISGGCPEDVGEIFESAGNFGGGVRPRVRIFGTSTDFELFLVADRTEIYNHSQLFVLTLTKCLQLLRLSLFENVRADIEEQR